MSYLPKNTRAVTQRFTKSRTKNDSAVLRSWLSPAYLTESFLTHARKKYTVARPFHHIALRAFFRKDKYVALKKALLAQQVTRKDADLFSFLQTADLYTVNTAIIHEFLVLLQSEAFTSWLHALTGVRTKSIIDAAGFTYDKGDYLLCHDDKLAGRKIAYIMYCSTLTPREGGAFCLFSSNKKSPVKIVKKIYPQENMLVLFSVVPGSYHAVEEVLGKKRHSIAGWFHG